MRLATWNVLHGTSLQDGSVDADRLAAAAVSLDADVLALQEIDRDQPRSGGVDQVAVVAAALGAVDHRFEAALHGTPGGDWTPPVPSGEGQPAYGVGLVSRVPVQSWHTHRMRPARGRAPVLLPDRSVIWLHDEPRVAVAAVLDGLTVAATHLSFVPGWNAWQLRGLVRWLRTLPGPHVLLGDLNLPAGPAALASGWRPLGRRPTYPAPRPRVQLDHVLGRGDLPPVTGVSTPVLDVSDHRPLVVDL